MKTNLLPSHVSASKAETSKFITQIGLSPFALAQRMKRLRTEQGQSCATAPALRQLKKDVFDKKLPVQFCAGSSALNLSLSGVLKNMSKKEIYKLKFRVNHETKTILVKDNPQLTIAINNYIKKIPEFFYNFRPKTNEKDLPHHSLATFHELLINPEYQSLSYRLKNIMNYITPSHDTGKTLDSTPDHAALSARMLAKSLENVLSKEDAELAFNVLSDHHYSYNVINNITTVEEYAQKRTEEEFMLVKLLSDADLASKEVSIKNLRRMAENKIIFQQQAQAYKKMKKEFVA